MNARLTQRSEKQSHHKFKTWEVSNQPLGLVREGRISYKPAVRKHSNRKKIFETKRKNGQAGAGRTRIQSWKDIFSAFSILIINLRNKFS